MIDPFFFDRLMHAFTTAHATPLSQAAAHAAISQPAAASPAAAPVCRALREAETVGAEALCRAQPTHAGTPQADRHV